MTGAWPPLFQEALRAEPFWMLVACSLVNLTTWEKAEGVHRELRRRYPDAAAMARSRHAGVRSVIAGLGLGDVRTRNLRRLAAAVAPLEEDGSLPSLTGADVERLPGCGLYARHSWEIFIEGLVPARPTDKRLKYYLAREGLWPSAWGKSQRKRSNKS